MIYSVNSKLVAFAICFLLPQFTFAGEVPSKSIDCNLVAELADNDDEYFAGIFAVTIYLRGLMDGAKNGFDINSHNMHTKIVETWLDVIIETCDRKMSSELYKVAKRLR